MNSLSVSGKNWLFKKFDSSDIIKLSEDYNLSEIVAKLLAIDPELQSTDVVPKVIFVEPAEHLVKDAAIKLLVFEWFVFVLSIFALAI